VPVPAQTSKDLLDDDASLRLRCLIEGEAAIFPVTVAENKDISDLKILVHEKIKNGTLRTILAKDLVFLKVSNILESSVNIVAHLYA
jgi:hypothetical protein